MERVQDEFFHLFEALKRRGARMMFVADRAPGDIENIDERLRSRFEGGLALELTTGRVVELRLEESATETVADRIFVPDLEVSIAKRSERRGLEPAVTAASEPPAKGGAWFPSPENVVIHWPRIDELLIEEMD
jgi:chromosomal replication initiator protein